MNEQIFDTYTSSDAANEVAERLNEGGYVAYVREVNGDTFSVVLTD